MCPGPPRRSTLFPYTTLFRSEDCPGCGHAVIIMDGHMTTALDIPAGRREDRKSTRLNSSHRCIAYAVFCLEHQTIDQPRTNHSKPANTSLPPAQANRCGACGG